MYIQVENKKKRKENARVDMYMPYCGNGLRSKKRSKAQDARCKMQASVKGEKRSVDGKKYRT